MARRAGIHEAKTHLSDYVNRVAYGGERIVLERHGKPIAALVGLEDLRRIESLAAEAAEADDLAAREARFRQALGQAGIEVSWPAGPPMTAPERALVRIAGLPISEHIVAERR